MPEFLGGRGAVFSGPPGIKPTASPWTSMWWVKPQHSADGNSYRPGEPIPFEEAVRQGQIDDKVRIPPVCTRCRGGKRHKNPQKRGHAYECRCPMCGPCPRCGGSGRELDERAATG